MNIERGKIEPEETPEEAAYWDRRIEEAVEMARRDPRFAHHFEPEDEAESLARARADYAAGRCYDHAIVGAWLKTWGNPDGLPFQEWLKQAKI